MSDTTDQASECQQLPETRGNGTRPGGLRRQTNAEYERLMLRMSLLISWFLLLGLAGASISGQPQDQSPDSDLAGAKIIAEIVQAGVTTIGILVGGWWTYTRFLKHRQGNARAKIRLSGSSIKIPGEKNLLDVEFDIENSGAVKIPLRLARLTVKRVLPIKDHDLPSQAGQPHGNRASFPWPEIERRCWEWDKGLAMIEPGESQLLTWSFWLDETIDRIELTAYFENSQAKTKSGWTARSVLDFKKGNAIVKTKALSHTTDDSSDLDGPVAPQVPDPDENSQRRPTSL